MRRFRTPLLIIGLLGALVVAAAVFVVIRAGRGVPVALPIALDDIPPGSILEPQLFQLEQVRGLAPEMLEAYVTADEFARYQGLRILEIVHAGFPVGEAQVSTEMPNPLQDRLTLLLGGDEYLVYPLPVTPDQVGSYLFAGDRVDVVLTLGRVAAQEMSLAEDGLEDESLNPMFVSEITETVDAALVFGLTEENRVMTTTAQLPVAKVVLTDVLVLRVEREQVRTASTSYGMTGAEESQPLVTEGDVIRVYLQVDRSQAEILSFALNSGAINLPSRAQPVGGGSEGFAWDSFVELFFAGSSEEER